MSILTTLALVVIPLVRQKKKDRMAELEERLAAVEAERDLWRNECLVVRQRLTEATIENIHLGRQGAARMAIEWADCTCVPDRAEALTRGE